MKNIDINANNAKTFLENIHYLDCAVIRQMIRDLGSQNEEIRKDAYADFGIDEQGNPVAYEEPFFLTKDGRNAYREARENIVESVKNGTVKQYIWNAINLMVYTQMEVKRNER